MKNVVYVNRPNFVVNAKGSVIEGVRPDVSKNQREIKLDKRRFNSLREFLNWITKEGTKKSSITYLMDVRPATNGMYEARVFVSQLPRSSKSTSSSSNKKTSRTSSTSRSTTQPSSTVVTPTGGISKTSVTTNSRPSANSTRNTTRTASVNRPKR